jgi:TonB-dependent receptor
MSRFLRSLLLLPLLINALWVTKGAAQDRKGTIGGRVTDSAGAVLQGAQVELEPRTGTSTSDGQGEFTITGLAPGSYKVTVSYVGFAPYSMTTSVTSGQIVRLDARLQVASPVEQINVTAERVHGEAEAINRERASDNILQVLPVEVITSLPNTNIADALGRLPSVTLERDEGEGKYVQIRGLEPRLSNVTINGVNVPSPEGGVRQIKLDVIPANLVESVEINKTLAANQDGDAIGGSVNLVTKTAEEQPTLYLNGIGGYTPIIGGRTLSEFDGTIGKRFGASKKLGIIFGGSYDWNGRGIDDVEPVPTAVLCSPGPGGCNENFNPANATNVATYSTEDLREYRYYRTRYGFAGSVDYKLGDISGLYIRGIYSHFDNFGDRWVYTPTINTFETPTQGGVDGNMSFNAQIRRPVEVIGSLEAGGKHVFDKWWLAYDLSVSRSASEDHGYSSANFNGPAGSMANPLVFDVDASNPHTPKLLAQSGPNNITSIYDPTQYSLAGLDVGQSYSPQVNLQGAFSAAKNYTAKGHFGTFEFGAKFRNAHKFEDARDPVYNSENGPAMAQFLGSFTNSNYYDKAYTLGPTVDYGKVQSYFNANVNDPTIFQIAPDATAQNSYPNNYDLIERVSAGYLMNTIDVGRFRVQTGLRFEGTNESLLGNQVFFDANGFLCTAPDPQDPGCPPNFTSAVAPVRRNSSYLDALPSVQIRFRLPHDAAIRAVYGRGIARPNYSDLPPTFNAQGNNNEIDIGNPNLKPTYANNYDLLYEQYLKPLGLLQAGFFYKQLSDPIYESVKTPITTNQYGSQYNNGQWVVAQPINGLSARVYGFEIAYQQHLTFLPHRLAGIGISANYGYTHSSTDGVPGRSDKPPLQRQAPNTWNISPTYDRGRFSGRLGISHNDANIFSYSFQDGAALGIKGPNGDTYLYPHTQVDAQASVRVYRGLQFVAAGLNLTNEVFGFYNGSSIYPIQREYYKTSYMFGLRYTLSNEPR